MLDRFKNFWQGVVLAPVIDLLIRLGVSPDVVTLVGTLGVLFMTCCGVAVVGIGLLQGFAPVTGSRAAGAGGRL